MSQRPTATHGFRPDYSVSPGSSLAELLEALGMSQAEFAIRSGLTPKTVNLILNGRAPITPETALKIERVTDSAARFWLQLESNHQDFLVREHEGAALAAESAWVRRMPVRELQRRGQLPETQDPVEQCRALLSFFGVSSVSAWKDVWQRPAAAFRRSASFRGTPEAFATWLRLGERQALEMSCTPFSASRFRSTLTELRRLTRCAAIEFVPAIKEACAACGVAVALVPEIKGAPARGATRWLSPERAMLLLSLRYRTDDQFWFSFFHEAGHILLHGKKVGFLDDAGTSSTQESEAEREADAFARSLLIPASFVARLDSLQHEPEIVRFAGELGISPGIVVGRLQHDGLLPHTRHNVLKARLDWDQLH